MKERKYTNDAALTIDEIVDKYYGAIHANAMYLTNFNEPAADDITQSVFLLLVEKWQKLDPVHIGAWLFETERRKLLEYYRTVHSRGGNNIECPDPLPTNDDDEALAACDEYFVPDAKTLEEIKDEILAQLSEEERGLYKAYFLRDMSVSDVTALYSISYDAATSRIRRLREKLYKFVDKKANDLNLSGFAYISFVIYVISHISGGR